MSLQEHLYTQTTIPMVLKRYITELNSAGGINEKFHALKLSSYQNMIEDEKFLKEARNFFNGTYDLIDEQHPGLKFSIAGRRKSLISVEKKIHRYFNLEKSLDLIRDFFAFRIILFGDDSIDLVQHCYLVLEQIIEFAAVKGFTPCQRLPLIDVPDLDTHQNPYFSACKYKQYVKDYICFPKKNGYKSLHLVLQDIKGRYLEVQIRTLDMHAEVESGAANHKDYKSATTIDFPFNREDVSIEGYLFTNNQTYDFAGVEYPITIFQRQKTF